MGERWREAQGAGWGPSRCGGGAVLLVWRRAALPNVHTIRTDDNIKTVTGNDGVALGA